MGLVKESRLGRVTPGVTPPVTGVTLWNLRSQVVAKQQLDGRDTPTRVTTGVTPRDTFAERRTSSFDAVVYERDTLSRDSVTRILSFQWGTRPPLRGGALPHELEKESRGMNINNAFPAGSLLKAADLRDREVRVVIEDVEIQEIGGESKPVVTFEGKEAGLALNKTNARSISEAYGDETDGWRGRPIVLVPSTTEYQGRNVACIRIRIERDKPADDEIPF